MKELLILFMLSPFTLFSQEGNDVQRANIHGALSVLTFDFNMDDLFWSFSGGIEDVQNEWGAKLNFEFRPFKKKVQIREDNNIIRQYKEVKYFISLDVDKRFLHFNLWGTDTQFFIGTRTGFLLGNYKGTKANRKPTFITTPMTGLCFNFSEDVNFKIGYIYFSDGLVNVPDSRVTLGLNFIL
jgi:hypothetical protein